MAKGQLNQQTQNEPGGTNAGSSPVLRVCAIIGLLVMAALLILLLYLALTGAAAGKILAVLFCIMIIPCLFYLLQLWVRITRQDQ